jgi:hypothetical protein
MLRHQRGEIDADGSAADHPPLARHHYAVGAVGAAEDERGERIVGAAKARLL